jgi:hypothetical protein
LFLDFFQIYFSLRCAGDGIDKTHLSPGHPMWSWNFSLVRVVDLDGTSWVTLWAAWIINGSHWLATGH